MEVNVSRLQKALNDIRDISGIPWKNVTEKSGVHNLGRIAQGQIMPTDDSWEKLHDAFPLDIPPVEYLKRGKVFRLATEEIANFSLVPKYAARLSCGHGSFEDSDVVESMNAFRTSWLRSKGNPADMALFTASGDSMKPFIFHGDSVLVDRSKNDPAAIQQDKAYAFREASLVVIKRLSWERNELWATPENLIPGKYEKYKIRQDDDFSLIGKIIWVGHEVY